MKSPKKSKEPESVEVLRQRQIEDLAKLDEEENRRIKALLRPRSGGRAFRAQGSARVARNSRGSPAAPTFGSSGGFRPGAGSGYRQA